MLFRERGGQQSKLLRCDERQKTKLDALLRCPAKMPYEDARQRCPTNSELGSANDLAHTGDNFLVQLGSLRSPTPLTSDPKV